MHVTQGHPSPILRFTGIGISGHLYASFLFIDGLSPYYT